MNAAENGPENGPAKSERERLFNEIAALREQRNTLMRQLSETETRLRELQDEVDWLQGEQ